jgi:hypothetical protein
MHCAIPEPTGSKIRARIDPLSLPKMQNPLNRLFFFFSGHSPLLQPPAYFLLFLPAAVGLGATTFAGTGRALAGAAPALGVGAPLCIQLMICCVAIGMMNNNALFP